LIFPRRALEKRVKGGSKERRRGGKGKLYLLHECTRRLESFGGLLSSGAHQADRMIPRSKQVEGRKEERQLSLRK